MDVESLGSSVEQRNYGFLDPTSSSIDHRDTLEGITLADLARKMTGFKKRLEKVEARLLATTLNENDDKNVSPLSKRSTHTHFYSGLITSIPRNEGVVAETRTCFHVLKINRFATFQSLVLFSVVVAMVSFGFIQIFNVDESLKSEYKPFKMEGQDEYYLNEELEYTIPKHYFLVHMQGWVPAIHGFYRNAFNESCEETLESCLATYMYAILTKSGDPRLTASCYMVAAEFEEETGLHGSAVMELRNFSVIPDKIGFMEFNGTELGIFGLLLKLEFDALPTHMNGALYCVIGLDMDKIGEMLPGFVYDIYFFVSRNDEDFSLFHTYFPDSFTKVWARSDAVSKYFDIRYDEVTYDKISNFQAQIYAEVREQAGSSLTIHAYPKTTVFHYISYNSYSYLDWMADMGGVLSLAVGFFVFTASRITKLAQRNKMFHTSYGILPMFSLPHRNAEELARLRFMILDALDITEMEYFEQS